MSIFPRKLSNAYKDGVSQPRSTGADGSPLPNPRKVSITVNELDWDHTNDHNVVLVSFAQFLGNDIAYIPQVKAKEECRECDLIDDDCMTINSLSKYLDYTMRCKPCIEFTRSADGNTTPGGERNQLNQVTSYLDASQVYGSTTEIAESLKDSGGRLKTQSNGYILPQVPNGPPCGPTSTESWAPNEPCFLTGDDRASENAGLTAIHTLFVMEHNRIADFFKANTAWTDEQIFQETRRIVIAIYQHIVYAEFLPMLLSDAVMTQHGLHEETGSTFFTGYDGSVDVTPYNEFYTAAWTFMESMAYHRVSWYTNDTNKDETKIYMNDNWYNVTPTKTDPYIPIGILEYSFVKSAQKRDKKFVDAYHTYYLRVDEDKYIEIPKNDKNTVNIQRGRDHGLQGYNAYRSAYGLSSLTSIDDFATSGIVDTATDPDIIDALKSVYKNVNDVDLVTGISFENSPPAGQKEGLMGDVASHMIGEQFENLKKGDRYFYSGDSTHNPAPFSTNQLKEIRRTWLASVACQHLRSDAKITRHNGFRKYNYNYCFEIPKMDLNVFLSPTASETPSNVTLNYKFYEYDDAQQIEKLTAKSQDWCDRVCRQTVGCIAWNYKSSDGTCRIFNSMDPPGRRTSSSSYTHGEPPSSVPSVTPVLETNTEDKQNFTLGSSVRCILEKDLNEDVGVIFYENV